MAFVLQPRTDVGGAAVSIPALSGSTVGVVVLTATAVPPLILMTLNVRPGNFRSSREKKP